MQRRDSKLRDRRTEGISEVVGFVIILAVMVAGMSLYLTYAVPVQGREEEITVMDDVRAWFIDYKTDVDQIWLNSPLVPSSMASDPLIPIIQYSGEDNSTLFNTTVGQLTLRKVINVGTVREKGFVRRYLPVLAPIPASAEISVRNTERFTIAGWRNGNPTPDFTWSSTSTALAYTSHNNYWFQQEYYYQLGGVFLRQNEGSGGPGAANVMVVAAPPFSIYDFSPEEGGTGYQTKVGLVVVNMDMPTGGFGATSPIRVESRLNKDPTRPDTGSMGNDFAEVSLQFDAANATTAQAWKNLFTGAAARNRVASNFSSHQWDDTAWINITGFSDVSSTNDVLLEVLVADYSMSLENVPTLIE